MSAALRIKGGEPLRGSIACSGAKNFVTKAMVAALLARDPTTLYNIPNIGEVEITQKLCESVGASVIRCSPNSITIEPSSVDTCIVSAPDSRINRIPILFLSVLLHRFHKAQIPLLGGDQIGSRNINYHINALNQFGATIKFTENAYIAEIRTKMKGCEIKLPYPSVMTTENCLFLAVLAEGTSVFENVATEPEIKELITMLRTMGAEIFLDASKRILRIDGVKILRGTTVHVMGDRMEAASWAALAAATDGTLTLSGIHPEQLDTFLPHFQLVGGGYRMEDAGTMSFFRRCPLRPLSLETDVYPGFATDWQQPFSVLLTQASGLSSLHETVYEHRLGFLQILDSMGADTRVGTECLGTRCRFYGLGYAHSARIRGPTRLQAPLTPVALPTDIRGSFALFIAAAIAQGTTILTGVEEIERGYGDLVDKLRDVNLDIERIEI